MSHYETMNSNGISGNNNPPGRTAQAKRKAFYLYQQATERHWLRKIGRRLSQRANRLWDLTTVQAAWTRLNHRYAGQARVQISAIRGSSNTGRCRDFDADFRPLAPCDATRWQGVATARQLGRSLPPVRLIRIRDLYFVEDGHHRISVAQALGEAEIDAEVTEWQVAGPLPWENQPQRSIRASLKAVLAVRA